MTEQPEAGETFSVECPHCGKSFEAPLLGDSERNMGFKCPHCRLFVSYRRADEDARAGPASDEQ